MNLLPDIADITKYLDEAACRRYWTDALRPSGSECPHCGATLNGRQAASLAAGRRVHCHDCGRWSHYRTGTVLSRSAADDRQLFAVAYLLRLGLPVRVIAAASGVSDDTVYRWRKTLLTAQEDA